MRDVQPRARLPDAALSSSLSSTHSAGNRPGNGGVQLRWSQMLADCAVDLRDADGVDLVGEVVNVVCAPAEFGAEQNGFTRSEERRVGKECRL